RPHHAHRALAVVAVDLQRHVHHAAGIHRVIRCVQHAALLQLVADRVGGQLVVGRAADDLRLDAVDRLLVDGAAQRAGAVHVGVDVVDLVQAHGLAAQLVTQRCTASLLMSVTNTLAPCSRSSLMNSLPTWPQPCTAKLYLPTSSLPCLKCSAAIRPCKVPNAVNGEGSPEPPCTWCTPVTYSVSRNTYSMSLTSMPTSSAVM